MEGTNAVRAQEATTRIARPVTRTWVADAVPASVPELRGAVLRLVGEHGALERARLADLKLAVGELLANAVKHAYPDGPGQVRVEVCINGHVEVKVADDGVGIGAEAGDARKGIGLVLVRHLADEMHVRPAPNAGTEAAVTFAPAGHRPGPALRR